jgi:hypothetical protein
MPAFQYGDRIRVLTKPEFAVISAGSGNWFGLARAASTAPISTGVVTFYRDGKSVTPSVAALQ